MSIRGESLLASKLPARSMLRLLLLASLLSLLLHLSCRGCGKGCSAIGHLLTCIILNRILLRMRFFIVLQKIVESG